MYQNEHSQYRILDDGSIVGHSVAEVKFKPLTLKQIERYVDTGEPLDKAGSYGLQGRGATFVEYIHGDYTGIIGLPLSLLSEMLAFYGIDVF